MTHRTDHGRAKTAERFSAGVEVAAGSEVAAEGRVATGGEVAAVPRVTARGRIAWRSWAGRGIAFAWLAMGLSGGCAVEDAGVPEGMLARVRSTVIGPEDLMAARAQLGAYGQQRFKGAEGQRQLLAALIDAELLAQQAGRTGLGDDPRVEFAVLEEIAAVHASAELQRRVPREPIAADEAALREAYERLQDEFTTPQRRQVIGVLFRTFEEALAAQQTFQEEGVDFESRDDFVRTQLQARDDDEFPGFHPILFDPALEEGQWLPVPVVVGERLLVGKVERIEPPAVMPFDDPAVQERLVAALRAPRVEAVEAEWMETLAQRYPEVVTDPR